MSDSTHAGSPKERLEAWREEMHPVLMRLRDFELPPDFPFDFSAASLFRLEEIVLDRFPRATAPAKPTGGFLESATAYVGETLLRAGGGQWDWDAGDNLPVVRPDSALTLPGISPLRLIVGATNRRTGKELTGAYASLVAAIDEHRAQHPGWAPAKEPTPGLDEEPEPFMSPWLATWLGERERAFLAWSAGTGENPTVWDFSLESVEALEALLRHRLDAGTFAEPGDDFAQGAAWYFGEVARRQRTDARWQYNTAEPGSDDFEYNPYAGRPYIRQSGADGNALVPILIIKALLRKDEPGYLAGRLATLA